jgi:hypothetical protein
MIEIVPATPEIMKGLFDGMRGVTVKAIAMLDDGEVIAVGGAYRSSCGHVLFMKATEKAKKKPKALFKAAKEFAARYPKIHAYCDMNIDGSDRFLKHLGMEKINGDVWRGSQQ